MGDLWHNNENIEGFCLLHDYDGNSDIWLNVRLISAIQVVKGRMAFQPGGTSVSPHALVVCGHITYEVKETDDEVLRAWRDVFEPEAAKT